MCNTCNQSKQSSSMMSNLAHGILGVSKAVLKIDQLNSIGISNRRDICSKCDKNNGGICSICHCIISLKTTIKSEMCADTPAKW